MAPGTELATPRAATMPPLLAGLWLLLASCESSVAHVSFTADRTYDTIVVVGGANESHPLFIYGEPVPALLDDSTVAFSDRRIHGRMVVANLLTGDGWEIVSRTGEEGPGEFGNTTPFLFPYDGVLHSITVGSRYNGWAFDGELIASHRFEEWVSPTLLSVPVGMVENRVVVTYIEDLPSEGPTIRRKRQGFRIYDVHAGVVADVAEGIPEIVLRVKDSRRPGVTSWGSVSPPGLMVAARGETIAWGMHGERRVSTLDASGSAVAVRELDECIWKLSVDADERVWAHTFARDASGILGQVVMDRDLNELFRVAARFVMDASGNHLLAIRPDDLGVRAMVLLRMRDVGRR